MIHSNTRPFDCKCFLSTSFRTNIININVLKGGHWKQSFQGPLETMPDEKQRSLQRKSREHRGTLPSHCDNATHEGISISQPCYEGKCMEWTTVKRFQNGCVSVENTGFFISHLEFCFQLLFSWNSVVWNQLLYGIKHQLRHLKMVVKQYGSAHVMMG